MKKLVRVGFAGRTPESIKKLVERLAVVDAMQRQLAIARRVHPKRRSARSRDQGQRSLERMPSGGLWRQNPLEALSLRRPVALSLDESKLPGCHRGRDDRLTLAYDLERQAIYLMVAEGTPQTIRAAPT
jgi:hypothetical protein